ncbi:ABC transporter permease [Cognatishimia maritima]|nr:ABC transporter permease [Cognatishimia maritima]
MRSFRTSRTVAALVLREMSTTYGRSAFGYFWAIAEPAAGIILLTLIFSLALRTPSLGTNFPLFYASGLLPFMMYLDVSGKMAQALRFSRPLLAFPAITYADPLLARLILNGLTQCLVMSIVLIGIIVGFDLDVILEFRFIAASIGMALALATGLGTLNCYLFMRFPVWERVWAIVNRPLFFISGIFFLFESIPEPYASVLWFNPLVHVTGEMRRGIYVTYEGAFVSPAYVYGLSAVSLSLGLLLLRRHYKDLVHR